jgi:hypothetical protein
MLSEIKTYKTLLCLLYGIGVKLTMMEKRRLRVFENRVLRKVLGHKKDDDRAEHVACVQGCGGEARGKETPLKTKA